MSTKPTNFENGVNNLNLTNILGALKELDPTQMHTYFNDFDTYASGDWTITNASTGTIALENADGGSLLLTNNTSDDDLLAFQLAKETFKFESGKQLFFKARLKVSDATQSDVVMGLQITDTSPLSVSDGVYFIKSDGAATLNFVVVKNSTATTASAIATLSDATYITVAFAYNGVDKITYAAASDSNAPTILGSSAITNLPDDEELTISFAVQNGEAAAKTMSVDYIFVAKER